MEWGLRAEGSTTQDGARPSNSPDTAIENLALARDAPDMRSHWDPAKGKFKNPIIAPTSEPFGFGHGTHAMPEPLNQPTQFGDGTTRIFAIMPPSSCSRI